jgi:hypothetical protein
MNRERLLNVAKALRESNDPRDFSMEFYGHVNCNTPACALGHYAHRTDLQDALILVNGCVRQSDGHYASYWTALVREHFDIDRDEVEALFSDSGCGNASTAIEAAEFIERFVDGGAEELTAAHFRRPR